MSGAIDVPRAFTVLLVCTGNVCRSALAERLGRVYLRERLGERHSAVRLVSAGVQAVIGSGMNPDTDRVLAGFGARPQDFRARQLHERDAVAADLTLAMTRRHRQMVLEVAPRALARTFTLREAADLLHRRQCEPPLEGADFVERARALMREMAALRHRRQSWRDDDIRDPIGQPLDVHQEVGDAVAEALLPVLRRLVPRLPTFAPLHGTSSGFFA